MCRVQQGLDCHLGKKLLCTKSKVFPEAQLSCQATVEKSLSPHFPPSFFSPFPGSLLANYIWKAAHSSSGMSKLEMEVERICAYSSGSFHTYKTEHFWAVL